jgi:rare lipoprotein A
MRLPNDRRPLAVLRIGCALSASLALAACATGGGAEQAPLATAPLRGPQADYPIVIGEPYAIGGTTYTPEDVLNYDQVGYLAVDASAENTVSGAHHTLPLPSYVEVTSLETGRTILVRLERRGPMNSNDLLALAPGALTQLGATTGTPVRVRRVNPPEDQRALLRAGQQAPQRIDTPMALVEVLKRRLPGPGAAPLNTSPQLANAARSPALATRPSGSVQAAAVAREPRSTQTAQAAVATGTPGLPPLPNRGAVSVAAAPGSPFEQAFTPPASASTRQERPVTNGFVVQAGAFSTADRADRVADALDAKVSRAGNFYRVRTGPFATRREAEASLAKVRAAGYRDARIQTSG